MGVSPYVSHSRFPTQGSHLGKRVRVMFNYDDDHIILGTVIRDDLNEPYFTIIKLDDGRAVLTLECQYSIGEQL